jgi:hypothetical protein
LPTAPKTVFALFNGANGLKKVAAIQSPSAQGGQNLKTT